MFYTKGLRELKIYCGDELIGESPVCYSNEPVPIKISQNDMSIDLNITTNYEFEKQLLTDMRHHNLYVFRYSIFHFGFFH